MTAAAAAFRPSAPLLALAALACSKSAGEELLAEVRGVYAECDTYVDSGRVETHFVEDARTNVTFFETAFVRDSGELRFEARQRRGEHEWKRFVVWTEDDLAWSYWTVTNETRAEHSVEPLLGRSVGCGGSSQVVPAALFGFDSGRLSRFTRAEITGQGSVDGRPCTTLVAYDSIDHEYRLWVDSAHKVVLKMQHDQLVQGNDGRDDFHVTTTTTWSPDLNVEVPASSLGFERPTEPPGARLTAPEAKRASDPRHDPEAKRILDRVRQSYSAHSTYRDEGVADTYFFDFDTTNREYFSTAFDRQSGDFRVTERMRRGEYEWGYRVHWTKGGVGNSWSYTRPELRTHEGDKNMGLHSGIQITTLDLLLDRSQSIVRRLEDPVIVGEESVAGVRCVKLEALYRGAPTLLWIDGERDLLLKTESVHEVHRQNTEEDQPATFVTRRTTTWNPEPDARLTPEELTFDPDAPRPAGL